MALVEEKGVGAGGKLPPK